MRLTKYCHPEHNIRDGCKTIRFGSFKYYREMEANNPLSDYDEGTHTIKYVSLQGLKVEPAVIDAHTTFIDQSVFDSKNAGRNIVLADNSLRTIHENHFIWCCSIDDGQSPSDAYASNYKIEDVHAFQNEMAAILGASTTPSDFAIKLATPPPCVASIGMKVAYMESRKQTLNSRGIDFYCDELPRHLWPYGVKSARYSQEKEFRLMFVINDCHEIQYEVVSRYKDCIVTDRLRQLVS